MKSKILFPLFLFCTATVVAQQKEFNILNFGAIGDGKTVNTAFIQNAIDKAAQASGSVVIPAGRFVSGMIHLRSNVELHFQTDAILLGSTHRLDYGKEKAGALISAVNQKNISITGNGEIDGRGREVVKDLIKLLHQGVLQDAEWKIKRPMEINRPKIIEFTECSSITVKGVTIKNAACWVQDYIRCNTVKIDSIKVISTEYWNNDGIDIVNCKNVSITHCVVDAADDAICLKSEGSVTGFCDSIYVADCKLRSSASAFKIGTGSKGGFKNIVVRNLEIFDTYRSAIALEAVDGGYIENVDIKNIKATNTGNAIFIRLGHRNKDEHYSTVKNISISNVIVSVPENKPDAGYPVEGPALKFPHNVFPSSITGLPGHNVENVLLENIEIIYEGNAKKETAFFGLDTLTKIPENVSGYPEFSMFGELPVWGFYVRHVNGLSMKNISVIMKGTDFRTGILFDDVKKLYTDKIKIQGSKVKPDIFYNDVKKENSE